MALRSSILAGNNRLSSAASGGSAIKQPPSVEEGGAVRRIQKALVALRFPLPLSFPSGPTSEPDGKFGSETQRAVLSFQKREFPTDANQWDGRVGKNTLTRMDQMLLLDEPSETVEVPPTFATTTTRCTTIVPGRRI